MVVLVGYRDAAKKSGTQVQESNLLLPQRLRVLGRLLSLARTSLSENNHSVYCS